MHVKTEDFDRALHDLKYFSYEILQKKGSMKKLQILMRLKGIADLFTKSILLVLLIVSISGCAI